MESNLWHNNWVILFFLYKMRLLDLQLVLRNNIFWIGFIEYFSWETDCSLTTCRAARMRIIVILTLEVIVSALPASSSNEINLSSERGPTERLFCWREQRSFFSVTEFSTVKTRLMFCRDVTWNRFSALNFYTNLEIYSHQKTWDYSAFHCAVSCV